MRQGASGGAPLRSTPAGASPLTSFTGGVAGGGPAAAAAATAASGAGRETAAAAADGGAAAASWLMEESANAHIEKPQARKLECFALYSWCSRLVPVCQAAAGTWQLHHLPVAAVVHLLAGPLLPLNCHGARLIVSKQGELQMRISH